MEKDTANSDRDGDGAGNEAPQNVELTQEEVSLPGATVGPNEEQSIIHVLNNNNKLNATPEREQQPQSQQQQQQQHTDGAKLSTEAELEIGKSKVEETEQSEQSGQATEIADKSEENKVKESGEDHKPNVVVENATRVNDNLQTSDNLVSGPQETDSGSSSDSSSRISIESQIAATPATATATTEASAKAEEEEEAETSPKVSAAAPSETVSAFATTDSNTEKVEEEPTPAEPKVEKPTASGTAPPFDHEPNENPNGNGNGNENENVLDIESHLIETLHDYQAKGQDSVELNELTPVPDELTQGSSKIETDVNVRTVIEVEPAFVKTRKPVEVQVQSSQAPQVLSHDDSEPRSRSVKTEEKEKESELIVPEEVREAANQLVNDIEHILQEIYHQRVAQRESERELTPKTEGIVTDSVEESVETAATNANNEYERRESVEKTEDQSELLDEVNVELSKKVDAHLSEVTSILKTSKPTHVSIHLNDQQISDDLTKTRDNKLKIVNIPSPETSLDERERELFINSLPTIETSSDAKKLADDCKREYYQSLKKYLIDDNTDKPPIPLQTYRWEDLRRAKERGGYPWTHLYKRPLGPDEEPEIVLLLRKSQELRFCSESPKSLKKVRIDDQVLVQETHRYIQELSSGDEEQPHSAPEDEENQSVRSESISCVSDSVLATGKPRKIGRLSKIRSFLRRRRAGRAADDTQSLPAASACSSRHHSEENLAPEILVNGKSADQQESTNCHPIMKKLKSMADRQKKRLHIKRIRLGKDERIVLGEETKILRLKSSPKSERSEIPHFIEKQDSDDVLEIVELDESPSRKRRDDGRDFDGEVVNRPEEANRSSIVEPDEIIEIANEVEKTNPPAEEEVEEIIEKETITITAAPPKKAPRLRREHVYEEIEHDEDVAQPNAIFEMVSVDALKKSLAKQDNSALRDIEAAGKPLPLDRMGSSEEEQIAAAAAVAAATPASSDKSSGNLLAPISSIDSTSSDEDRKRPHLSPVSEESDGASFEEPVRVIEVIEEIKDLKPALKKEASPAPSDRKVTFSHVEDEAEPHREDIELPEEVREATAMAAMKKWKNMSDHEYEPIGAPPDQEKAPAKEVSPTPIPAPTLTAATATTITSTLTQSKPAPAELPMEMEIDEVNDEMKKADELQRDLEERYFSSEDSTPRTESRTDYEIHTSQVDSSALEELPLKPENRKKGFMASAQDRTRKMQAGLKSQAGKIKTKLRTPTKKPPPSSSPKTKERRKFKAPEFSKIKMPEIKRPDMSKLKEFKRPEFTKFNKPDMSKFKLPDKFSSLKLRRSKSFKENEAPDEEMSETTPQSGAEAGAGAVAAPQPQKKMFEFNFGTYPRAFRRKKKPVEPQTSFGTETGTEGVSVVNSTVTQPSIESSSSPQGDRGPGPVRSRWADKFSDVSYNDSEGSRYRRYGSEQESFDRESSLERRMKEDLEETASETQDMGIMGGVADNKQFAEFDEENRAIHEISKMRAGEFKRRPMIHQDSDLRSEDSKEAEGWTDKDIQKNKLLRKAELEAEASYLKYPSDEITTQETQSTASSGRKVVMEEIDDDEFFLRKRGISEDNIELRQYISNVIKEGYDMPINSLDHVGRTSEPLEYGGSYDIPPPKPRRLHRTYRPQDISQDSELQRSDFGDDLSMSQNGSDFFGAPKRPLRKSRGRSKYSMDSQDIQMTDENISHEQYFDDDEEYLRPPRSAFKANDMATNNLDFGGKQIFADEPDDVQEDQQPQPQAPRRRKRQLEKDSYMNGFGGRSVSNSFLQPHEDVIVFRTEHEYPIPLAAPEKYEDGAPAASRYDEDDRTSRGVDSLAMDGGSNIKPPYEDAEVDDAQDKFIIDMMENDGYAVVRKEHIPKPTPPARRKKFSRSPGERFTTMPNIPSKRSTPPPERPPPPRGYIQTSSIDEPDLPEPVPPRRKSAPRTEAVQNDEDDYEEPELIDYERPESPRDLQSGEIINKMKHRPLPPPPRPPREKRHRSTSKTSTQDGRHDDLHHVESSDGGVGDTETDEKIATSSTADSYDFEKDPRFVEVEVSTQTDPLPDDFVCEEFEITDDMKVIHPRRAAKTLDELLREEQLKAQQQHQQQQQQAEGVNAQPLTEDEQLARGLQRFRDANQRSLSEKSRASSSQADRSKSASRPQTPSAVIIERRVSTPIPTTAQPHETLLEASLTVQPIDDLDLEEEALRREGLLTDSSQHSKSDVDNQYQDEEGEQKLTLSDYSYGPSSEELNAAIEELRSRQESEAEAEQNKQEDEEVERTMRNFGYEDRTYKDDENVDVDVDEDAAERYSNHYDEDDVLTHHLNLREEKEADTKNADSAEEILFEGSVEMERSPAVEKIDATGEDPWKYELEREKSGEPDLKTWEISKEIKEEEEVAEEPPLPPPRRKSTTAIETSPILAVAEQPTKELTPIQSLVQTDAQSLSLSQPQSQSQSQSQLPAQVGDLEVERLRVHALQAGQIMVSRLHGNQISSDELECKAGNLVVNNIELPPGFIEDIVERVRSTDRQQLLPSATGTEMETQTSLQASSEGLSNDEQAPSAKDVMTPPPKPPRHRDLETSKVFATKPAVTEISTESAALERLRNFDEGPRADLSETPIVPISTTSSQQSAPPPVYASADYPQSLPPETYYSMRRDEAGRDDREEPTNRRHRRHYHHRHRHRKCDSSCSDSDEAYVEDDESRERRNRSRSSTRPLESPQTVAMAGRQFLSACSLSLVNIINQLTAAVRGTDVDAEKDDNVDTRLRHVPTLVVLFIVITFGLLIYLLSGKSIHTHHWDFFNPPDNEGRGQS